MTSTQGLIIELIESIEDFPQTFHCVREAFGRQAKDAVWMVMNPGWDTLDGQKRGVESLAEKWKGATRNKEGDLNTVFLKATLPDPEDATKRRVVGMAIWKQASFIEGHGDPPSDDLGSSTDMLDPVEQRFAAQMLRSLWKRRIAYTKEKSAATPPAIFALDMCAVDPAFQRRGIAQKLVQWGLDEAKRRGGLECTTEASSMGRGAYLKLGFKDEGVGDIVYDVDEEFKSRDKPPNIFLRTDIRQ